MRYLTLLATAASLAAAQDSSSRAVSRTTVVLTETPPPGPTQTTVITLTETSRNLLSAKTITITNEYKGREEYVLLPNNAGSSFGNDTHALSILGSNGNLTSYSVVPTVSVEYNDGYTKTYETLLVTAGPTTYLEHVDNPDVTSMNGEKVFETYSVWCALPATTNATCTTTFWGGAFEKLPEYKTELPFTYTYASDDLTYESLEIVQRIQTNAVTTSGTARMTMTGALTQSTDTGTRSGSAVPTNTSVSGAERRRVTSVAMMLGLAVAVVSGALWD